MLKMEFQEYLKYVCNEKNDYIFESHFPFTNTHIHFLTTGFDRFFMSLNQEQQLQVYEKILNEYENPNSKILILFLRNLQCICNFKLSTDKIYKLLDSLYYPAYYLTLIDINNPKIKFTSMHADTFEVYVYDIFLKVLVTKYKDYKNLDLLMKTILNIYKKV
jgi:hypothetical protein